jgi:hypothetical protein
MSSDEESDRDDADEVETLAEEPHFIKAEIDAAEAQIEEQTKRIDFYITEYSIELLANKMRNGDFVVPAYQREFTWEHERRTRFIESVRFRRTNSSGLQAPGRPT